MAPTFSVPYRARWLLLAAWWVVATVQAAAPLQGATKVPRKLVMVNAVYPPFINPPGHHQGEGMDVEIAREALLRGGYAMDLVLVPWPRALKMLENGAADFTTTISKLGDRDRYLVWTPSYRTAANYRFYSRSGAAFRINRLQDLQGKRLGVVSGFRYPPSIVEQEGVYVVRGPSLSNVIKMLEVQRMDLIAVTAIAGAWEIQELGAKDHLMLHPYEYVSDSRNYMAFSLKTDFTEPLKAMSRALAEMSKDGTMERITKKYQN